HWYKCSCCVTAYPPYTTDGETGQAQGQGTSPLSTSTSLFPDRHEKNAGIAGVSELLPYRLLPLSARSEQALYRLAESYRDFLIQVQTQHLAAVPLSLDIASAWRDVCYSASVRRTHHSHRLAVLGRTPREAAEALGVVLQNVHAGSSAEEVQHDGKREE